MRALALTAFLFLAACATPVASAPNLSGTAWTLQNMSGATNETPRRPTLEFGDARAHGSAGCNIWAASYTQSGADLHFGAALMTRMACTYGMDAEHAFVTAIGQTRHVETSGDTLVLRGENGEELARFVKMTRQGS